VKEADVNFDEKPFIVIWETTQACDLACVHCRASAESRRHPLELSTQEAERLIDEVAAVGVPVFVLTGGDPLKRPDIFDLVEYATGHGVRTSMTPSATPLLTREAIAELTSRGLARMALSLDGSMPAIHDALRGVAGSYDRTLAAVGWAEEAGLPIQINTTISKRNFGDFAAIARLVEGLNAVLWSVFFLVPTGRGRVADMITAEEFEQIFARLYALEEAAPFDIKTTEAQHYRRFAMQKRAAERRNGTRLLSEPVAGPPNGNGKQAPDGIGRAPRGINDAKGFVFVSHLGEVMPSGFLPISGGNIRRQSLLDIYQNSPLFKSLRDTSALKGKCGVCEFREVCGGSRARAYAVSGDALAEEPFCVYQPAMAIQ
jgi:AdoMet-dependent heme synthase